MPKTEKITMKTKYHRSPIPSLLKLTRRVVPTLRFVRQVLCLAVGLLLTATGLTQPVITTQPLSQTNIVGTTATFSVEATNALPIFYQWQKNATDLTSQTNTTLVLTNVQTGNAGPYSVVVSNVDSAVTSDVATLTVLVPPSITKQPTNQSASLGASATFSVLAVGTTPRYYQWRFNDVDMPGKTSTSLVLTNLQLTNAGGYTLVVTNIAGSATSQVASLTIDPTFKKITAGEVVSERLNSRGCAWGDYDNDGWVDLFVANRDGQNESLFRNLGDGTFTRVTSGPVVTSGGDSMGGGWGDVDNDGHLDLFVLNANGENEFFFRKKELRQWTAKTSRASPFSPDKVESLSIAPRAPR